MSLRQNLGETFRNIRKEYAKTEFSDKMLDLISIAGVVLFLVAFLSVFISEKFNVVNIVFIIYPLGIAGVSAAFRMRKRDRPEDNEKLFRDWILIISTFTVIAIIVIILGYVFI